MAASAGAALFLTDSDIDALALDFLHSEQAGQPYAGASLDRRLEVYLRHCGLARVADDGDLYSILTNRVLTYFGEAQAKPTGWNGTAQQCRRGSHGPSLLESGHPRN